MSIFPLFFLMFVFSGWVLAILHGPIWGLLIYIFVYFNIPNQQWWGYIVPDLRWSLISACILVISCMLHHAALNSAGIIKSFTFQLLLFILSVVTVTSIFSPYQAIATGAIYDFSRYVLIYFLVFKVVKNYTYYRYVMMVMLGTLFYFAHVARSAHIGGRLEGFGLVDANDSNMLATLVLLLAPFYIAFILSEKSWWRIVPVFPFVYVLNMFVLCQSRGALIGLLAQLFFLFFVMGKKIGRKKSFALCVSIVLMFVTLMNDSYKARILDLYNGLAAGKIESTSTGRLDIWRYSIEMIRDYPFGSGGGTYEKLSAQYIPAELMPYGYDYRSSHNTYLKVLVELGPFGFIAFILVISANILILLKNISKKSAGDECLLFHRVALLIGICGYFVSSLFIDRLFFECIYIVMALIPFLCNFNWNITIAMNPMENCSCPE